MHLEGTHTLNAPVEKVWNMLQDPEILAKITPGIKTLEATGENSYDAISEVKLGPVSGSFKGTLEVADKVEPSHFTLKIKQNSKIGNVSAEGKISLSPVDKTQTEVVFSGDAKLSGTLARTGQRVVSGVARTMTNQFFEALEEEISASQGAVVETKKEGIFTRFLNWLKGLFGG